MTATLPSAGVVRLPVRPRPRVVVGLTDEALAAGGIGGGNGPSASALRVLASPKPASGLSALDRLLADGTLDAHQHAAALAYGALRRRYERSGGPFQSWRDRSGMSDETWQAIKRNHARLIRAAGAERFVLDRLCLNDDAPLSSEVERVRAALERVAVLTCPESLCSGPRELLARAAARSGRSAHPGASCCVSAGVSAALHSCARAIWHGSSRRPGIWHRLSGAGRLLGGST